MSIGKRRGRRLAGVAALTAVVYARLLRRRVLAWGATRAEAEAVLAGDDLLPDADGVATRAIGIAAPPSAVWPWLVQMGPAPRAGAYTYDWIENLLGLNMHSADRVLSEFQHPRKGDTIGFGANRMWVALVDPERCLAWRSEDGNWVWSFVLEPDGEQTRLISRNRFRLSSPAMRLGMLAMEPASLVMERKMLRGISQRAEQLASEQRSRQPRARDGNAGRLSVEGSHEPPMRDPDAPPAVSNEEHRSPAHPYKDQGDALDIEPRA